MGFVKRWWITTGTDGRGFLAYDNADEAHAACGKHEDSERVVEVVSASQLRDARIALLAVANLGDGSEHPNAWQRIARAALDRTTRER